MQGDSNIFQYPSNTKRHIRHHSMFTKQNFRFIKDIKKSDAHVIKFLILYFL